MSDSTPIPFFPENLDSYAPWVTTHGLLAPYGECQCGCGGKPSINRSNDKPRQLVKGHPLRFCLGHGKRVWDREERFWSNVDKRGPDECWPWTGKDTNGRYGRFWAHGKRTVAHRVAYEICYGPIPDGLQACHHCDNPPCCNPAHLFLGTMADNMRDKMEKGRGYFGEPRKGELAPASKLTESAVIAIREKADQGISKHALADEYGVAYGTVCEIVRRATWKHI